MKKADRNALISFPVLILIGFLFGAAGSHGGSYFAGMPLFGLLVGLAFLVQWVAFVPAFLLQSERFFDLTGSLTYISVVTLGILLGTAIDGRSLLLGAMVVVWALRLGTFLFRRIRTAGKDVRLMRSSRPSFVS
jgi:steroid 5-alpha reductase family enzyme